MLVATQGTADALPLRKSGLYRSARRHAPTGRWDTIIVGSGIGGMACGAALSKHGQRVLLLEQHYVPGGMTHCFTRKGYRWDVGVHCVGEQSLDDVPGKLLAWLTDGKLAMRRLPVTYERFHFPDAVQFTYESDVDVFEAHLIASFPAEAAAIKRYFRLCRTVFDVTRPFYALKAMPPWVGRVVSGAIGWTWRRYWDRTTREVMDELFRDARLKTLLVSQWGYYGSPPSRSSFGMHAMVAKHFFRGAYYPVGGSESFARCLLETIRAGGGETYVRAPVDEILFEGERAVGVRLDDGRRLHADRVVSAIGGQNTVQRLLPADRRQSAWAKSLESIQGVAAYLCLNLGFAGDIRQAGASETNNWLLESWDPENYFWDVTDPSSVPPICYVSFPSLKDPALAADSEKRNTGEVLAWVHWETFERWSETRWGRRGEAYDALKAEVQARLLAHVTRRMPAIMKHLVHHEMSTPVSAVHFARAWHGGMYGYETTPARFANANLTAHTPMRGLYLTGSDVLTPGVTGALVSGVLTAAAIQPRVFVRLL